MTLEELKAIPRLRTLILLDEDDEAAGQLTSPFAALDIAEAVCPIRVFELLYRDEYRPVAAVRFRGTDHDEVRVYFERIDSARAVFCSEEPTPARNRNSQPA